MQVYAYLDVYIQQNVNALTHIQARKFTHEHTKNSFSCHFLLFALGAKIEYSQKVTLLRTVNAC